MSAPANTSGSIRRRLILQLVGSAAVLATLLFLLVQSLAREVAQQSQDRILFASATSIADGIRVDAGEISVDIPYSALSMLGTISNDRVFYRIATDAEDLTGYSDLPIPGQNDAFPFLTTAYRGDVVRVALTSRSLSIDGTPVSLRVAVAQTLNGQTEVLNRISRTAGILGLGFFALTTLISVLAARGAVRPLSRLADAISRRGPKDLRPVSAPVPVEMAPLVSALNNFMERLRYSLTRSEDFIAEAAHRVRTPLATVRAQAEVALQRVERPENRRALKEMIRAVDESSRSAGQLLDHAMVTFRADQIEGTRIDLGEITAEMVERLGPVADLKDVTISITRSDDDLTMLGDAILLQNAVRNILDNALKYGPEDSTVTVDVRREANELHLSVSDEGAGFPQTGASELTARFARGENTDHIVGSGLGLTIAEEVARAHDGRLTIGNKSREPGACVCLSFPVS